VQVLTDVKSVAAGQFRTVFVKNDAAAWAVGSHERGQLGDGSSANPLDPCTLGPLHPWTLGPLEHWSLGPLDPWTLGALDPWTLGPLDP
jgi:hypothetical protein